MSGALLTAGYDRALHAVAIADLLRKRGTTLGGLLVVSHFSAERIRVVIRHRGLRPLFDYAFRRDNVATAGQEDSSPLRLFLRQQAISHRSLRDWARHAGIPLKVVPHINHRASIEFVKATNPDVVIYAGGGIVHEAFIAAARGHILNAHSGPLPEVRGMNALEWSLLLGFHPTVTIHLIDRGIDTGPILERLPVRPKPNDRLVHLKERCIVAGILGLVKWTALALSGPLQGETHYGFSRQCFVVAPALRALLDRKVAELVR